MACLTRQCLFLPKNFTRNHPALPARRYIRRALEEPGVFVAEAEAAFPAETDDFRLPEVDLYAIIIICMSM